MKLYEIASYFFISCILYKAAFYLMRFADWLEEQGKTIPAKIVGVLCYPVFVFGIGGLLTLGVLDHFESKRSFRIHQEQSREIRDLAGANASRDRLLQYRAASRYNAPGAAAACLKLETEIKEAKQNNEDWYVKHLEINGLDPEDPAYFDFDSWLQKEYYKLGL